MVSAFAQATVTFTSQNYGAGKYDRCRKIYHIAMAFSLLSCGLLSAIFVLGRDMFLGFYSTDADVLYYAEQRIIIAITLELLTYVYEGTWTFTSPSHNNSHRFMRAPSYMDIDSVSCIP